MKYKTIRIYESTFIGLSKLSKKYNISKTELLEAMETYFYETGISPLEPTDVTTEVKKLKNQLISFIRSQEKEKLIPMIKKIDLVVHKVIKHIDNNEPPVEAIRILITKLASFIEKKHETESSKSDKKFQNLEKKLDNIDVSLQEILSKDKKGFFR